MEIFVTERLQKCKMWAVFNFALFTFILLLLLKSYAVGVLVWAAPSVGGLPLAQVRISPLVSSSPALDSVLTARSLEPASDSVSPSLSAPPMLMLCLSLSLKNKLTLKKLKKRLTLSYDFASMRR